MFQLVAQLWSQNPVIFAMVVGLVLFGTYAATIAPRQDDADDPPTGEPPLDTGAHDPSV